MAISLDGTSGISASGNITGAYLVGNGAGITGLEGNQGATGYQGATGAAGTSGTVGGTGATGVAGTNGATGLTGATGAAGSNGADGATGLTGATGAAGSNGADGATGLTGATGSFGGNLANNIDGNGYGIANVAYVSSTGNVTGVDFYSTGNALVVGNLTVQGTTVTVNSNNVTINDKFFNTANNAATSTEANGGGIGVGPVGAEYATLSFNSVTNQWNTNLAVSAGGNVQGTNILTAGLVSSTGNVIAGNVTTAGLISSTGNIQGGNLRTTGLISATGTITGSQFTGSGAGLSGTAISLSIGGSAGSATTAGTVTTAAQPNITSTGTLTSVSSSGTISTAGSIYAATAITSYGYITATGNVYAGNISIKGAYPANAANLEVGGPVGFFGTQNGNVSVYSTGNTRTVFLDGANGVVSASGTVTAGSGVYSYGVVSAQGNVIAGNVNVQGFGPGPFNLNVGNSGFTSANAVVKVWNSSNTATIVMTGADGTISATGNITANNVVTSNNVVVGSGTGGNISNANVITANTISLGSGAGGNISNANVITANTISLSGGSGGNISNANVITANTITLAGGSGGNISGANVISANLFMAGANAVANGTIELYKNSNGTPTIQMLGSVGFISATGTVVAANLREKVYNITDGAGFQINPANGGIQTITLGDNRTPQGTFFASGDSITLMVNDGSGYTITWTDTSFGPSGLIWVGGSAPTLATTGYTVITLWMVGGQVYGAYVGAVA